ncbi:MAG TPA: RsfS/YbeB/iojap family protein [Acidimicrobiia bacterium]|nr:RsfS/YbeB/iojap family protein [Acidimicrobiia bacterium]
MVHPHPRIAAQRFGSTLEVCDGYVVGVYDLSATGGPEHTVLVQGRSAAHVRKLATRVSGRLDASVEGRAPDGKDAWVVIDGGDVVVHILTDGAHRRFGLGELFDQKERLDEADFASELSDRLKSA